MPNQPWDFDQDIADQICEEIAHGDKSLEKICVSNDAFPSARTIYRWLNQNEAFSQQYAHARELQGDFLGLQVIEIADQSVVAEKRTIKPDGSVEVVIGDAVERSRLRVDARKWLAGKLAPKKYGEKVALDHAGGLKLTVEHIGAADQPKPAPEDCR